MDLKTKTDHATLLNELHSMSCSPAYYFRRSELKEAELLILHQERRIKELEAIAATPTLPSVQEVPPEDELLNMLGRIHPMAAPRNDTLADERLRRAYCKQQPWPVPDQACIVWRADLMRMSNNLAHKQAFFEMHRNSPSVQEVPVLPPIEVEDGRTYIPLPGGWEVQTKGKGSTFRLCHVYGPGENDHRRFIVLDEKLHKPLEDMAMAMRAFMAQFKGQK